MYSDTFQWVFQAVLIFQIVFIFLQGIFVRRREYFSYIGYMLCLGLYFQSINSGIMHPYGLFSIFPKMTAYFDQPLIVLTYFFYFRFSRFFLDIPKQHPTFNKTVQILEITLLLYAAANALALSIFGITSWIEWSYRVFCALLLASTFYLIFRFLQIRKTNLNNFIIGGAILIAVGSNISLAIAIMQQESMLSRDFPFSIPFQLSIIIELLIFTTGLGYKSFLIEREKLLNERNLVEQLNQNRILQEELQTTRNKLASDLHDDVGASLSSIAIYTDIARQKVAENHNTDASALLLKAKLLCTETLEHMSEMVWTISPFNDNFKNLESRMQNYAAPLLSASGINFTILVSKNIPDEGLSMLHRKNIFLLFKEALNNSLKYAHCKNITTELKWINDSLILIQTDDGVGFNPDITNIGNGLRSMNNRCNELGGFMELSSNNTSGTKLICTFPMRL